MERKKTTYFLQLFINVRNPYIELENLHNYKTKEHCLLYNKSTRLFNEQGLQNSKNDTVK